MSGETTGAASGEWVEIGPQYVGGRPHGMQFARPSEVPGEFEYWFRPCDPSSGCRECLGPPLVKDIA